MANLPDKRNMYIMFADETEIDARLVVTTNNGLWGDSAYYTIWAYAPERILAQSNTFVSLLHQLNNAAGIKRLRLEIEPNIYFSLSYLESGHMVTVSYPAWEYGIYRRTSYGEWTGREPIVQTIVQSLDDIQIMQIVTMLKGGKS